MYFEVMKLPLPLGPRSSKLIFYLYFDTFSFRIRFCIIYVIYVNIFCVGRIQLIPLY